MDPNHDPDEIIARRRTGTVQDVLDSGRGQTRLARHSFMKEIEGREIELPYDELRALPTAPLVAEDPVRIATDSNTTEDFNDYFVDSLKFGRFTEKFLRLIVRKYGLDEEERLYQAHKHVEETNKREEHEKARSEEEEKKKRYDEFEEISLKVAEDLYDYYTSRSIHERALIVDEIVNVKMDDNNFTNVLPKQLAPNALATLINSVAVSVMNDRDLIDKRFSESGQVKRPRPSLGFFRRQRLKQIEPEIIRQTTRGGGPTTSQNVQRKYRKAVRGVVNFTPESLARLAAKKYKEHLGRQLSQR